MPFMNHAQHFNMMVLYAVETAACAGIPLVFPEWACGSLMAESQ
jgi:hypothetical protein